LKHIGWPQGLSIPNLIVGTEPSSAAEDIPAAGAPCVDRLCRDALGDLKTLEGNVKKYAFDHTQDVLADLVSKYPWVGDLAKIYAAHDGSAIHKWHHYIPIYEKYFASYRNTPVRFLEIGVSFGGSLKMWREYLGEKATIYGIDINPACAEYDGIYGQVRIGSQADPTFLNSVIKEMGGVDVILDDGSHKMKHISASLDILFPQLTPGGVYMIEDLHTAYWPKWGGGLDEKENFFNSVRKMIDDMHHWYHRGGANHPSVRDLISGIHVHDSIVVLDRANVFPPVHSFKGAKRDKPSVETPVQTAAPSEPATGGQSADIVASCYGVEIPPLPVFGKKMIESLAAGTYEKNEILCAIDAIPKRSRILELGAGAGVVGAVMARNCDPEAILSIEANPTLLPHIATLHQHNGLSHLIQVEHAVVLTKTNAPKKVGFHIRGNFLGSGLQVAEGKKSNEVEVPVLRYKTLREKFPHDVIMMDIEGGELDFLAHADLRAVKVFIAEFHPAIYGPSGMKKCHEHLESAGLKFDPIISRGAVKVYRRGGQPGLQDSEPARV
jgi:FkbM family methyltransferase